MCPISVAVRTRMRTDVVIRIQRSGMGCCSDRKLIIGEELFVTNLSSSAISRWGVRLVLSNYNVSTTRRRVPRLGQATCCNVPSRLFRGVFPQVSSPHVAITDLQNPVVFHPIRNFSTVVLIGSSFRLSLITEFITVSTLLKLMSFRTMNQGSIRLRHQPGFVAIQENWYSTSVVQRNFVCVYMFYF